MDFRTEIKIKPSEFKITHKDKIVMLGSCFTDNVGNCLERDGFDVTHNPMGPLYNPASIQRAVNRAISDQYYSADDLVMQPDADQTPVFHCLDFASRYSNEDADALLQIVNDDLKSLKEKLLEASVVIITLGTAFAYTYLPTHNIVGNCHKIPSNQFDRRRLTIDDCKSSLLSIVRALAERDRRVIFTVSPIRHLSDGFNGNQLSKSTLLLAVEETLNENPAGVTLEYFPSYEIMMDDLRDYRFYASDMKHPSDMAVEYIYEKFSETYFSSATKLQALESRRAFLRSQHRPILKK